MHNEKVLDRKAILNTIESLLGGTLIHSASYIKFTNTTSRKLT